MIIDHHDDLGSYLRRVAPGIANSTFVKEASWGERPEMLDRDFALILVDQDGKEHRKLAMNDAGNTLSSIIYFLTKENQLPDSAIKLAAINLLDAAIHQGLYDTYGDTGLMIEKVGSAFDILAHLADTEETRGIMDERRLHVKEAMAGNMSYNPTMPTIATAKPGMPAAAPNTIMQPNTTMGMNPPNTIMKTASVANSYDLIKEAQAVWTELDPVDKRAFALIIKEAAYEEGASVPTNIMQYTGNELNPLFERIMQQRQSYTANPELQDDYDRLAKVAHVMSLEDATEALYLLDEQAGLLDRYGTKLPDPVLAVYGTQTKVASWSWNHGGVYCTEQNLQRLVHDPIRRSQFEDLFDTDLCDKFRKDPIKTFESRPLEQKLIIARMANSTEM